MDKMYIILMICLGSSLGSLLRFAVYVWIGRTFSDTFLATVTVNVVGSFFIGVLFVVFNHIHSPRLQLLLVTGLLASFTTFSTLSLDVLRLFSDGLFWQGVTHIASQLILGVSFCYFGVKIGEYWLKVH